MPDRRDILTLNRLRSRRDEILRIARLRGARNVRVFGSVARGDAGVNSDVDLLVDMEPGRTALDLSELILDLEEAPRPAGRRRRDPSPVAALRADSERSRRLVSDDPERRHLTYIHGAIALIERRTRGGRNAFLADVDIQDAVLWRLETLAEATNRLTPELKARHPEIRWRAIYGLRNIAAHGYMELQIDRVWEIIEVHLPALKAIVEDELRRA